MCFVSSKQCNPTSLNLTLCTNSDSVNFVSPVVKNLRFMINPCTTTKVTRLVLNRKYTNERNKHEKSVLVCYPGHTCTQTHTDTLTYVRTTAFGTLDQPEIKMLPKPKKNNKTNVSTLLFYRYIVKSKFYTRKPNKQNKRK